MQRGEIKLKPVHWLGIRTGNFPLTFSLTLLIFPTVSREVSQSGGESYRKRGARVQDEDEEHDEWKTICN